MARKRGTKARPTPGLSIGAGNCLRGALSFAWYRGSTSAGTGELLLALVARGDPISSRVLAESGVTYRAVCGVRGQGDDDGVAAAPGDGSAARALAEAAGWIHPPGRIARLLRMSAWMPRRPLPSWTRNMETVVDEAARSARAAGRSELCRADLAAALLSVGGCAAADVLGRLGVDRERLGGRLASAFGPEGPAPTELGDLDVRPSGWVLGFLLRSGGCALPGEPDSLSWRMGLIRMVMEQVERVCTEFGVPRPGAEHVLLAIVATYEDLAADQEQFGPGWEACFPAGRALAGHGITYERARQVMRALSPEPEAGTPPDDVRDDGFQLRKLAGVTPTARDGYDEAIRLLGREPRGKGIRSSPEVSLLGVLHEKNRLANRMLAECGVDRGRLRSDLVRALGGRR